MTEQAFIVGICLTAEIKVKHWILFPFSGMETVDGKTVEKFTAPFEIGFY